VELIQYLKPADRKVVKLRPCDVGFAHIAFDVDDIVSALRKMEDFQVVPMGSPVEIDNGPNKGNKVAYLRDPDGLTIEFIEKPKITVKR
jgi:catechol 2,3-dioxygenase-like lactoylglutathione lyase family enzyme